jgi:uncharacterized protein (TIGR03790 family)
MIRRRFFQSPQHHAISAKMLVWLLLLCPCVAHAGGGPENVLVMVNARSWASLTIANYYVALRRIPASHVLSIDWQESIDSISGEVFRNQILLPLAAALQQRKLDDQIDYLVYSCDFPTVVNLGEDLTEAKLPPQLAPVASITGASYLAPLVIRKIPGVVSLNSNYYAPDPKNNSQPPLTLGFRAAYQWDPERAKATKGIRYHIAAMLGCTQGRGNTVREVIDSLTRSAQADAKHPRGVVYYMKNDDVRSQARHELFPAAVAELKKIGVRAQLLPGTLPAQHADVQGLMTGAADYAWAGSHSKILAGGIADNFTSWAGVMEESSSQTPVSEWIRAGAAGTCGSVFEPYAIPEKFPSAWLHVHYARGATLGEAFYQSIRGPYQQLLLGDPLCQPFAKQPSLDDVELPRAKTVSGEISIATPASSQLAVKSWELHLDGHLTVAVAPGTKLALDTTQFADGTHELRIVAIADGDLETHGGLSRLIQFDNRGRRLEVLSDIPKELVYGDSLTLKLKAPGANAIVLDHLGRILDKILGEEGEVTISTRELGMGPVSLVPHGLFLNAMEREVVGRPITFDVRSPIALPAQKPPTENMSPGLLLTKGDGTTSIVTETHAADWLALAGVAASERCSLSGWMKTPSEDVYQFVVHHQGKLAVQVDEKKLYVAAHEKLKTSIIPCSLAPGEHFVKVTIETADPKDCRLAFGGPGSHSFNSGGFRCQQSSGISVIPDAP